MPVHLTDEKYLTDNEVARRYSCGRATVWRWTATRLEFPKPVRLGPGVTRWRLTDLLAFEAAREGAE